METIPMLGLAQRMHAPPCHLSEVMDISSIGPNASPLEQHMELEKQSEELIISPYAL